MMPATVLASYAIGLGLFGPTLLSRLRWVGGSPRLGLAVWCAALWSMVCAGGLAIGLGLLSISPVGHLFLELMSACLHGFHRHHGHVSTGTVLGVAAAVGVVVWMLARGLSFLTRTGSARHRHRAALSLVGRFDPALGVTVVSHPGLIAYCLPGGGGRIVVTSGTLNSLTPGQLAAVIAHERAHLRGRHHLLIGIARISAVALPRVPLAQRARPVIDFLVERIADETACRTHDRAVVSSALDVVGNSFVPGSTLGMGGADVAARTQHLDQRASTPATVQRLGALALTAGLILTPLMMSVGPAAHLASVDVCAGHSHSDHLPDHG